MEILSLKSAIKYNNWSGNSLKGLNTRFKLVEDRISKLEDRSIKCIQGEEQNKNNRKWRKPQRIAGQP